jgi:hypothetical protein
MNKENSMTNEWDRLKKEHPAIVSDVDSESYERLRKALIDKGHITEPFIENQMQEAHDCIDNVSDGSTASYYELPDNATELQHLISHKNMNAQMGEIFRSCYRYGIASHSDQLRDAKKIKFYIEAEIERLEAWSK